MSLKKTILSAGAVATALAMLFASAVPATAAKVPSRKANAGDECGRAGMLAKGRGVEGSDLRCTKVTFGSYKDSLRWWYPDLKPLTTIDWTVPAGPGGYSATTDAIAKTLITEGLLTSQTTDFKPGAGGTTGLAHFQTIKGKQNSALIIGIALTGGMAQVANKNTSDLLASTPIARVMREYNAIFVPANSKYKTLNQFVNDVNTNGRAIAVSGGNVGGVDHQVIGALLKTAGVPISKLNYVVGTGSEPLTKVLSGAAPVGVIGVVDVLPYVADGKLRILGISSPKPISGVKAKTFIQQGYNLVYGNWRGVMAPADITEANRINFVKVMDVMRSTPTWKEVLATNKWYDEFAGGKDFGAFLKTHIPEIKAFISEIGL
ncbi:MAG: Bug family tripartite tricarboxylate transporter substrate binding protein [Candidatus Nanopelagicaceae bacterium]